MRLKLFLLFIVISVQHTAHASCSDSLKKDNVARRIVQVGGVALGLWVGGAFLHEEDSEEINPGYDYERIEMIRRKKIMQESPSDVFVKDSSLTK